MPRARTPPPPHRPGTLRTLLPLLLGSLAVACSRPGAVPIPLPRAWETLDPALAARIEAGVGEVEVEPRRPGTWGELGMVYEAGELNGLALACYDRAAELDRKVALWPYRAAVACSALGDFDGAIARMTASVAREKDFAPAHWRIGLWLLETGDLSAARAAFRAATRVDPADSAGWVGLALVELRSAAPAAALEALARALELRPDDRYARYLCGIAYRDAGRRAEAEVELEHATGARPSWRDPRDAEIRRRRVGASETLAAARRDLAEGRGAQAAEGFETLLASRPRDVGLLNNLALAHLGTGRAEDAEARLLEALALTPENVTTLVNLALVREARGDRAGALARVERAVEISPELARAHELRGVLLRRDRRFAEARAAFRAALQRDARDPTLRLWIGQLELDLGLWREAQESFSAATRDQPASGDAFAGLAMARLELGEWKAAARALGRAEELGSADPRLIEHVRRELERRGDEGSR